MALFEVHFWPFPSGDRRPCFSFLASLLRNAFEGPLRLSPACHLAYLSTTEVVALLRLFCMCVPVTFLPGRDTSTVNSLCRAETVGGACRFAPRNRYSEHRGKLV